MERTANLQGQSTLCSGCLKLLASLVDGLNVARNDKLTRTVVIGRNDNMPRLIYGCTHLFNLFIGQANDGCHGRRSHVAGFLHSHCTGINQLQAILEAESAGCNEC